jgi:hypothetical protein
VGGGAGAVRCEDGVEDDGAAAGDSGDRWRGISDFAVCLRAPDLEEREAVVPVEVAKIFKGEKRLAKWYEGLGVAMRRDVGKWIEGVKSAEARQRRAVQIAEWLMLAMEGEKELPPVLDVAFRRVPEARKGWEAMTKAQRRAHLLGVFHYRGWRVGGSAWVSWWRMPCGWGGVRAAQPEGNA